MSDRHTAPNEPNHPCHPVDSAPWPVIGSSGLFLSAMGAAMLLHQKTGGIFLLSTGAALVAYCMFVWWRDVIFEANTKQKYANEVCRGLRIGMALFIMSEALLFASFFWIFFTSPLFPIPPFAGTWAIAPVIWPPGGLHPFNLPLLGTMILLLSCTTVNWARYAISQGDRRQAIQALLSTIILGLTFTGCQSYEYTHAAFGLKNGIYASTFFMATGFQCFHVIAGTIFLTLCFVRTCKGEFTPERHLGFELASWFWYFANVLWLLLFVFVYCGLANKLFS